MDDHSDRSSPLNIPATGFIGKGLLATLLVADEGLGLDCRITVLSQDPGTFLRSWPALAVPRQQASLDQFRSGLWPTAAWHDPATENLSRWSRSTSTKFSLWGGEEGVGMAGEQIIIQDHGTP